MGRSKLRAALLNDCCCFVVGAMVMAEVGEGTGLLPWQVARGSLAASIRSPGHFGPWANQATAPAHVRPLRWRCDAIFCCLLPALPESWRQRAARPGPYEEELHWRRAAWPGRRPLSIFPGLLRYHSTSFTGGPPLFLRLLRPRWLWQRPRIYTCCALPITAWRRLVCCV